MNKNAQKKLSEKLKGKISCHYTWLLHAKNCLSPSRFSRSFLAASKPSRSTITTAKRKEKEKRKLRHKKILKIENLRDVQQVTFDFCGCPSHNVILVARKASCCVANAFSTGLKIIWPRSSLKTTQMSKIHIFCKKLEESMG